MRSKQSKKRQVEPDIILKSKTITKLVNIVMLHGKKSIAENIVYSSLDKINEDRKESLRIFEQAVKNVMPKQEVRSRRIGGATYQVPYPVRHDRGEALALKWIVEVARKKQGKAMDEFLKDEIMNAYNNMGDAIRKRDDVHKMAESNKAFSHFRL
ncbi:MAG: 30S ribosomal protein S7 [Proteobacteria bacterium]|nr:30S ribosomal protein S7 [Pseudomonadota bacterium]